MAFSEQQLREGTGGAVDLPTRFGMSGLWRASSR